MYERKAIIKGATAIGLCCQLVALLCALLAPYLPHTCTRLREQLNVEVDILRINPEKPSLLQYLPTGHVIGKPEPLFAKIESDLLEQLRAKYAGTQSDRAKQNSDVKKTESKVNIADLEAAVAAQGDKVRQLKASTKDKAVWQPEVNKLLDLKKQLEMIKSAPVVKQNDTGKEVNVASLEKAIAAQGDKVRKLKASTKDKAVWQPEVNMLLDLKKQLEMVKSAPVVKQNDNGKEINVASLEKAIAEQGDKVRQLKASTKDKSVWQPEVDKLLQLKKKLAVAQAQTNNKSIADTNNLNESVASLEKAIAEQGDKVRKIKASTKDKTVWQPEVNILLELKKRLSALQVK